MKHKELVELMGKLVTVRSVLERTGPNYNGVQQDNTREWRRKDLSEARTGWVVGHRWLQRGHRIPGWGGEDPTTFQEDGPRTPCLLVSWWPTKKPVRVPLDGWRAPTALEHPRSPSYRWTNEERRQMRLEAIDFERDEKGRFVRYVCKGPS